MIKCKICREHNLDVFCHNCNMLKKYYAKRQELAITCRRCGDVFVGTVGRKNCKKCRIEISEGIKICKLCKKKYKGKRCCIKEKKIKKCNCGNIAIAKGYCRKCYDKIRYKIRIA